MFAGLPELGISNGEDLKETLTNCTEPLKAIDQFQVKPRSLKNNRSVYFVKRQMPLSRMM